MMKRVSFGRPSFGMRYMFERKKTEYLQEPVPENACILDLIGLKRYRDHFYDYLAINEDYYLPEEELREYYVPGSNLRKYFVVQGEHVLVQGGKVLLDGKPVGELKTSDEQAVERWQEQGIIQRMEVFLGGGAFKQIRLKEEKFFDWEKGLDACEGKKLRESVIGRTHGIGSVRTAEKKEENAADKGEEERIEIWDRRIPYYAYLYLELEGKLSAEEEAEKRTFHWPFRFVFRRKPKLRRARARGRK